MSYTYEDFHRDLALEWLKRLPPEDRLRGLPTEERLRGISPEEILRGLDDAERARLKELLECKETDDRRH